MNAIEQPKALIPETTGAEKFENNLIAIRQIMEINITKCNKVFLFIRIIRIHRLNDFCITKVSE